MERICQLIGCDLDLDELGKRKDAIYCGRPHAREAQRARGVSDGPVAAAQSPPFPYHALARVWARACRRGRVRYGRRPLTLFALAAVLLPVLVLAGCGGGGGSTTTVTSTTVQATPAPASASQCPAVAPGGQQLHQTQYGCQAHAPDFGKPPAPSARPKALLPGSVAPVRGPPTIEMFDSVTVSTVPHDAQAVAGYTSGFFPTFGPLVAAFPHAYHVSIAISATSLGIHVAKCLDVEPGDANPTEVVGWYHFVKSQGVAKPCFYASLLNGMSSIKANLTAAGISRVDYFLWDANWTLVPHLDLGYDATQWTDHSRNLNLDESTVTKAFLGIAPPPQRDPFGFYDKAKRTFTTKHGKVTAREYNTISTGRRAGCKQPYRRRVCTTSDYHAKLLLGRDLFVANHRLRNGHWVTLKHPDYSKPNKQIPLGSRIKGLRRFVFTPAELHNCRTVAGCMP